MKPRPNTWRMANGRIVTSNELRHLYGTLPSPAHRRLLGIRKVAKTKSNPVKRNPLNKYHCWIRDPRTDTYSVQHWEVNTTSKQSAIHRCAKAHDVLLLRDTGSKGIDRLDRTVEVIAVSVPKKTKSNPVKRKKSRIVTIRTATQASLLNAKNRKLTKELEGHFGPMPALKVGDTAVVDQRGLALNTSRYIIHPSMMPSKLRRKVKKTKRNPGNLKIKPVHYKTLKAGIKKIIAQAAKKDPNWLSFSLSAHQNTRSAMRTRWDLLYAASRSALPEFFITDKLYPYLNDDHIDSALRAILAELAAKRK